MKFPFWLVWIFALALAGQVGAQMSVIRSDYTALKIIEKDEARFPLTLQSTSVMEGDAWVVVRVDVDGRLTDWLVTGYTRKEFADTAVAALKGWSYEPATLRGEKWATVREIHFMFKRTGVVISQTSAETIASFIERLVPSLYSFRAFQLRELDRIPVPRKVVPPEYPPALADKGVKGFVTVEFYIDATGKVRLPAALDWSNDDLANLAVTAVKDWEFEPPLRKDQPVLVLVRQQFNFQPKL